MRINKTSNGLAWSFQMSAMDPTYPLIPIANFSAFVLSFTTFLVTISARQYNIGVIVFAIWLSILSIVMAIDTIIWSDNSRNSFPVWCKIGDYTMVEVPRFDM